jgi:hypothetical protein
MLMIYKNVDNEQQNQLQRLHLNHNQLMLRLCLKDLELIVLE